MPALPMDRLLEYISVHYWLATATAVVVALIAVYEMRARSESLVSVTPQDLIRLMNQGALLLDLRPPEQYQVGHLAGARQSSGARLRNASATARGSRSRKSTWRRCRARTPTCSRAAAAARCPRYSSVTRTSAAPTSWTRWRRPVAWIPC